ncbi:bifunctional 3-(3-hydroxy-phenyl)propionate/3-hydroxycinnamic acid hydroxylase [Nocardioides marmotae]|uniref:Bifunctional 3-(3-hydroxy-phenyl)propionate/3-hydroxycinnamic acid hydroxylase n=1 Tax=Nocardioides marmotae TaxID=2663857 RepID=A0A6I3J5I7_9ACTN|nr:bifunctional 3-(3-hydroxy-phenyl)propionate/3-hydroxycinnamic acid hydroxylase [Nocardioides marmotae]MCR6030885.1 bifunctional 3-(3-hydroxy-phenyl)propionate/3-hydroxycinnamic acid hydroxylase [Gordonia jinghuaiqii]MBC9731598.1 bifunctional 3-(3-hydroxy-phenyl)propionate/3-hydroxycinnamic acid hydroxylase [Nocardioides marmotae]MTB82720.1 bifunctional 3-(3-hydroxy-phenyl)propionate/3-hydroxycinnamic acid hydroxylase [Nocardioides marmotae]MTB94522.1 bifunctional 3-(3-hydroxy-phenyl)propiona
MSEHFDADVAIVGYGPTGLAGALTLAAKGASVIAFERDHDIYARARAVTINDWTMRIFQELGVDERVEKVIEPENKLRWVTYDGHEIMRTEHAQSELGTRNTKPRFFNIYQPRMEAELRRCAEEYDALEVRLGVEVIGLEQDDAGVTLTARDRETGAETTTRVRYVIAADGGSSPTRKALGIAMLGDTAPTQWIVIDCRAKRFWPDSDCPTFWTDAEHPVVDISLAGGHHRWEIALRDGESEADYPTAAEVWPLLHAVGKSEEDVEIDQYAFYRHHVRAAESWREGRVFLAGDAAHLMPPWAGAGMQSGIRDAHNLGWKLARVLRGELGEEWLDTYEAERRPNVEFFTNIAVGLGRVITQQATPEEIALMDAVPENTVTPHEQPIFAPPVLQAGWLRGELGDASIVGRMLPQPHAGDHVGARARLDELIGHGFVLLGAEVDPTSLLTPDEKAAWDALGATYRTVRSKKSYTEGENDLVDLDDTLLPWFARYGVQAVAVRPDKFIAASDKSGLAAPAL